MGISSALLYSVLGVCVVFFALILLMIIIKLMVKIIPAEQPEQEAPVVIQEAPKPEAPGTAGEIALNGVEPRIAAMCMAIVADELKKPLNELRFISIKEIKE